jgi:hypothetical protein
MYREDLLDVFNLNMISFRIRPISLTTASMLFLATMLVACSDSDPTPVPVIPEVTAPVAIEQSKAAMGALVSFSFQLTHDSGHTTLSGALKLTRAGGLVATNGLDLEAEANIGRAFVRVEAVVIDEQTWMTNPLTGVWSKIAPEDSPFSFLDPVKLVADILGDTQDATYTAEDPPPGILRITGKIPAVSLAALVGTVDQTAMPRVFLNLDAESKVLWRVVILGVVQPEDDPDTVRVITLSDFDKQVTLEPPI